MIAILRYNICLSGPMTYYQTTHDAVRERSGSVVQCLTRDFKGPGFEPQRRRCVVVLEQDTFILV